MRHLRERLFRVIVASSPPAVLLAACTEPARPPRDTPPVASSSAGPSPAAASTAPAASATLAASVRPGPPTSPTFPASWKCDPAQGACSCFAPFSVMHGEGLSASPRPPFKHTFDKNGCPPSTEVSDSCCNPATQGPSFQGGECCYQFRVGSCCGRPLVRGGVAVVATLAAGGAWG